MGRVQLWLNPPLLYTPTEFQAMEIESAQLENGQKGFLIR